MQIIKPLQLTLLNRPFIYKKRFYLSLGAVYGFELTSGKSLLEQDVWEQISKCEELQLLDAALPKHQAEFLIYGCAETPEGDARKELLVDIRVGDLQKSLQVQGAGFWQGLPGFKHQQVEETFNRLPLSAAFSYGGQNYSDNPEGLGHEKTKTPEGEERHPITQLQLLKDLATEPGKPISLAFTGALDLMAPQRQQYAGTYDDAYQAQAMPGLPDDFDFRFCQDALPDQRFDSQHLPTSLSYSLQHLNADYPQLKGQVPFWQVTAWYLQTQPNQQEPEIKQLKLLPETLFLLPNQNLGLVLYRGQVLTARDDARDISALMVALEDSKASKSEDHYQDQLRKRSDQKNAWRFLLDTQPLLPDQLTCGMALLIESGQMPKLELSQLQKTDELKKEQEAKAQKNLDEAVAQAKAINPDYQAPKLEKPEEPEWQKKVKALESKILPKKADGSPDLANIDFDAMQEIQLVVDEAKVYETQKMLDEVIPKLEQLLQNPDLETQHPQIREQIENLINPPLPSWPRHDLNKQLDAMSLSLKEQQQELEALDLPLEQKKALEVQLSQAVNELLTQKEKLGELALQIKETYLMGAEHQNKCAPILSPRELDAHQKAVRTAIEKGRPLPTDDLADMDLSGLNLDGWDFSYCYMEGVNLTGTSLKGARLYKTILVYAELVNTDFTDADLQEANLGSSHIKGSCFAKANLNKVRLNRSNLQQVNFNQARMDETQWLDTQVQGCDFTQASMRKLNMIEPSWQACHFKQTDLSLGNFVNACFSNCNFEQLIAEGTNFVELIAENTSFYQGQMNNVRFVKGCQLSGSDFREASLKMASFRESQLQGSKFDRANLEQADLELGNFTGASFYRSNLFRANLANVNFTNAYLEDANLMEASLYHARVVQADLRGANLYAANFLYMEYGETRFDAANLDRTLLQNWRPSE